MIRELDARISDGIYVRLLWHSDNVRVSITVDDAKTGEAFELLVRDGEERSQLVVVGRRKLHLRKGALR